MIYYYLYRETSGGQALGASDAPLAASRSALRRAAFSRAARILASFSGSPPAAARAFLIFSSSTAGLAGAAATKRPVKTRCGQ